MENREIEPVMLSSIQHYLFCPRQFALIHIDQVWSENYLTASGRLLHERVDANIHETRRTLHIATTLRLSSATYGIFGVADMVEYHRAESPFSISGERIATDLPNFGGWWQPFPVEYKHGKPKDNFADEAQLCAQALCLEEMHGVKINNGALFYGTNRRRTDVTFTRELRELTISTIDKIRELLISGISPNAIYNKACNSCSLLDICCPKLTSGISSRKWIEKELANL